MNKYITVYGDFFEVVVWINSDYTPYKESDNLFRTGYIALSNNNDSSIWVNLDYFIDFTKMKAKECKAELKEKGLWQKGMIKELKAILNDLKKNGYV